MELNVTSVGKQIAASFDPESSDIISNMMILGQLVSTLVVEKHGNTGESSPFLAKQWDVSQDGRVWNFYLHDGVVCEDGVEIDAPGMIRSMTRIFKQNTHNGNLPVFDRLIGWKKFIEGRKELPGMEAPTRHLLRMTFNERPAGLIEYLGMPIYGYWCDGGFDGDRWRDKKSIVSSGPYRVKKSTDDGFVELERRDGWKLLPKSSPDRIVR